MKVIALFILAFFIVSPFCAVAKPARRTKSDVANYFWSVHVSWFGPSGYHNLSYFQELRSNGYNTALLYVPWGAVEYGPNEFNFSILYAYMNYTLEAKLKVVLVTFYSVAPTQYDVDPVPTFLLKNGELEVNPDGQPDSPPALSWWNLTDRFYYFGFLKALVNSFNSYTNLIGYSINFGWLDDAWGPSSPPYGNGNLPMGYSVSDLREYRNYLQSQYGTIQNLDRAWNASFSSFSEVTLPLPFTEYWPYFQQFRIWSINETYSEIYALIKSLSDKSLFLYFGGSASDVYALQLPEVYFQIAKRYNITVLLDDADHLRLSILMSNMARIYDVNMMTEWPSENYGANNRAYYGYYLSHISLFYPGLSGGDYIFFVRSGQYEHWETFALNAMAVSMYNIIKGAPPVSRVALLFVTLPGYTQEQVSVQSAEIEDLPTQSFTSTSPYCSYAVITPTEIDNGLVNLSQFRYLVLMTPQSYLPEGVTKALNRWEKSGGQLLSSTSGLPSSMCFAQVDGSTSEPGLYLFPLVSKGSAYLVADNWEGPRGSFTVSLNLSDLGLTANHVIILNSGMLENAPNFSLNFHGQTGTLIAYIFNATLNKTVFPLRILGVDYNSEENITTITVAGNPGLSGKLLLIASSQDSYSPGLIYAYAETESASVNRSFAVQVNLPGDVRANCEIFAYLFSKGYVITSSVALRSQKSGPASANYGYALLLALVALILGITVSLILVKRKVLFNS
ncbi:MAG: beta-galactosidase [Thermoprotei archaeon]